ncbi:MAG: alpha/beta hydrolase [Planctomycetaceae bacterium]|nr:alpha/beta hydrolase [Planctomycetaceae bacterium]
MPAPFFILAVDWSQFATAAWTFLALWTAFWIYVWVRYFPIVYRLIGEAPRLVAEISEPLSGGEECAFRTGDGLTLRGTYLKTPAERRAGVVLFGHELNGDRWNATPYVRDLIAAGYDVFTFDFRNHGASDAQPNLTVRPWIATNDVDDVAAAVDYLASRPDGDPRGLGVLAISRAAGAAICVAGRDSRIRCLFTDGAYPTHATHLIYLRRYIDIFIPYPWTFITRRIPDWVYHIFLGAGRRLWGRQNRYRFVNVEQAARGVRVPVMMVHGGKDRMIPVEAAQALRKCIAGPAKLWVVAEAKHNGAVFTLPDEYRRRLLRFFAFHLGPRPKRSSKACVAA